MKLIKKFMEDEQALRKKKQLYLIENVAEDGFDTSKFNKFLAETKGPGFDLEVLSFEQLVEIV